jgi:hypothetical protein
MKLVRILAFLFLVLIFCSKAYAQKTSINNGQLSLIIGTGSLDFSALVIEPGAQSSYLEGYVTNNTNRDLLIARVKVLPYDKDGNLLRVESQSSVYETATFDIDNLKRGQTKKIQASIQGNFIFLSRNRLVFFTQINIARYEFKLVNVVYTYSYDVSMIKPVVSKDLTYADDFISIKWMFDKKAMSFTLQNKTDNPIKVDWNQASFVDVSGNAQKIIHQGVKYINLNDSQSPTIIPPNAKLQDLVIPTINIHYSEITRGWIQESIFPAGDKELLLKGASFTVFMPLEINGTIKNYSFTFNIVDVK